MGMAMPHAGTQNAWEHSLQNFNVHFQGQSQGLDTRMLPRIGRDKGG